MSTQARVGGLQGQQTDPEITYDHESLLERILRNRLHLAGLPPPAREITGVVPGRRFRFDLGYLGLRPRLLIECEGGTWTKGGHSTGGGIARDCTKSNLAQLEGFRVLRFTADQIEDGSAVAQIRRALEATNGD